MEERREHEQYFFDAPTIRRLADLLSGFPKPLCLCAPLVGAELTRRGVDVTILDIDRRFADLPGFRFFDLQHPSWIEDEFGAILCDPPFFGVSLSRLRKAILGLAHHDPETPLFLTWLRRRQRKVLEVFSTFGIRPSGFLPTYETVPNLGKFEVELLWNLPEDSRVPGEGQGPA